MFSRLSELAESPNKDLPDTIDISRTDLELFYPIWLLWRATEKHFLPSQLMKEPAQPLAVLLELDSYFDRIADQTREQEEEEDSVA